MKNQTLKRRPPFKVWDAVKKLMRVSTLTKDTPTWGNDRLPELSTLQGFQGWEQAGVHSILKFEHLIWEIFF